MAPRARQTEAWQSDNEPDLVRHYLDEVGRTALLSAAEEVDLAKRIEAGVYADELLRQAEAGERRLSPRYRRDLEQVAREGLRAKDHMVRANLRLVVSVAKKYSHRGLPLLDVIQEGNLGLIRAVEKFDYAKGYKFSTYATWWIRQSIERGLAMQERTIRLPVHVVDEVMKLRRVEQQIQRRLDREPTAEETAAELGVPVDRVVELHRIAREALSLDTEVGEDGETRLADLIEDVEALQAADEVEFQALGEQVRALVDTLPPREALVVSLRYGLHGGEPCTLQEVARRIGLTREGVRQLERRAMAQLRDPGRSQRLLAWAS
ncbi:RNA polymerase principal sigma factor HrdC [Gandjariella thermophila]|uniref:RNA polymerase sigma factor n=2 Tax=Gandjariella thermophila TaxID=1931992 RepID=A0A4D4J1C8_9PSEU|nr:RNA polymerase principal sigma factor HrdC [Gandjariella thermophila]